MPKKCPECGQAVETKKVAEQGQAESVAVFCTNLNCYAQQQRRLEHFVSKKAFDIDGLGGKIIEQLMAEDLLENAADIFILEKSDLIPLERFAERAADNLISAIAKARTVALPRFIYALGIPHVGEETALALAKKFTQLEKITAASQSDLAEVADIGPVVASSIHQWFAQKHNSKLVAALISNGVQILPFTTGGATGKLAGKKVVVTGTLAGFGREEIKAKIRAVGGDWVSSVSKNTDYVLAGDNPGSKLKKAQALGIKIISESEFLGLLK